MSDETPLDYHTTSQQVPVAQNLHSKNSSLGKEIYQSANKSPLEIGDAGPSANQSHKNLKSEQSFKTVPKIDSNEVSEINKQEHNYIEAPVIKLKGGSTATNKGFKKAKTGQLADT